MPVRFCTLQATAFFRGKVTVVRWYTRTPLERAHSTSMRRFFAIALLCSCTVAGIWQSHEAEHPLTRAELSHLRVTVIGPPALAAELAAQGFTVVAHAPYHEDLELRFSDGVGTLRADGYFVEEVHGDPAQVAQQLARSSRVAMFHRDSGTPEQRANPGM
jgi:hypothetical protein